MRRHSQSDVYNFLYTPGVFSKQVASSAVTATPMMATTPAQPAAVTTGGSSAATTTSSSCELVSAADIDDAVRRAKLAVARASGATRDATSSGAADADRCIALLDNILVGRRFRVT